MCCLCGNQQTSYSGSGGCSRCDKSRGGIKEKVEPPPRRAQCAAFAGISRPVTPGAEAAAGAISQGAASRKKSSPPQEERNVLPLRESADQLLRERRLQQV